jgi:multidrug efflux pump subunit AcrA (membrane-fusion protein)
VSLRILRRHASPGRRYRGRLNNAGMASTVSKCSQARLGVNFSGEEVAVMRALISNSVGTCLIVAMGCAAMSLGSAETNSPPDEAQPAVIAVRTTWACFTSSIRVTGFFVAKNEAVVTLDAPGMKIAEVLAVEGDRVKSDQVLARLTRQSTQGPDTGAPSSLTLRAPADGVITRSTAVVGATPSPMTTEPLFRIAIGNEIELEADVPSVHVPSLAVGQSARIQMGDGSELLGRVRVLPAVIDQRRQLGRARLSLERSPLLRIGMFASATIDAARSCGLSVPRTAVYYRTEGTSVQIVNKNTIEKRLVQVGLHSNIQTEIRQGLKEGELVVADAGSSLRPGDKVRPIIEGAK